MRLSKVYNHLKQNKKKINIIIIPCKFIFKCVLRVCESGHQNDLDVALQCKFEEF